MKWKFDKDFDTEVKTLITHACSEEELGLAPGRDKAYYKIFEESREVVSLWQKKFKCVKPEELEIWGDFDSEEAQEIQISFKMCTGRLDCHSEADIRKWLKGKYIAFVYH